MGWEDDVAMDGWPADKALSGCTSGYGYDDVMFMPGHTSFEASEADIKGQLTIRISLRMPLLSAPVCSVTEWEMATNMALVGSMGFIHCNQTIESQAEMVRRVKRFVSGFILEPFVLSPKHTVADLVQLKASHGVGSVAITADGKLHSKLLGWVGARDTDTVPDQDKKTRTLETIMVKKVVTGQEPITLRDAQDLLRKAKVGKLPIVDADGRLMSIVARSDVKKFREFPIMSLSDTSQLLVGAAVDIGEDSYSRAQALIGSGVDVLLLDGSEEGGDSQVELIKRLKAEFPETEIISGPAASCREAKRLADAGVDAVLIGSAVPRGGYEVHGACAAVGRPEATAMFEVGQYVRKNYQIPAIAGPGVVSIGHAVKALCLGASAVLLCEPLAGTDEAPGAGVLRHGARFKLSHGAEPIGGYRAGLSAKQTASVVPLSFGRAVCQQGSVRGLLPYLCQGLRAGLQDLGAQSIPALHQALDNGELRVEVRSPYTAQLMAAAARTARDARKPEVMPFFVTAR